MDPVTNKLLQGTPYAGMGGTQERNALIGVIRNLILQDKYTVDYILNYAESVGYQRQMAEDVFKELTGLSPKLIVNNNEYYNMPSYVPNMCIAWGTSKSNKEKAFYVVPFEYGYDVMEKDEVNAPIPTVISATIPEAFDELKKVAKGIQTLDKIITKKLLEAEDVQTDAHTVHQVNLPYAASPLQILKKNFKDKVLSVAEFERQASKLLASEEITVDEAEDLMAWKQDLIDEDESYANEVLQIDENWKPLDAEGIDENAPGYENRVKEAFTELSGMIEELDIFEDYAKRSGKDRLFDAYLQLGREIADEWDIKPESLFGEMTLSAPELTKKLEDIDKENFNKEVETWKKSQEQFPWKGGNKDASLKKKALYIPEDDAIIDRVINDGWPEPMVLATYQYLLRRTGKEKKVNDELIAKVTQFINDFGGFKSEETKYDTISLEELAKQLGFKKQASKKAKSNIKKDSNYWDRQVTIMEFCDENNMSKEQGSILMDLLDSDDWNETLFTRKQISDALNKYRDNDPKNREHWFQLYPEENEVDASLKKKSASKKVTAENMTLDDIEEEDNKDQVQEQIEKIDETPAEDIFAESTPEDYLDKALQEDKVDTINDVVSKCIDKFSEKFKDFDKYQVKILSYNTKVLGDDKPVQEEMVEDKELNANAILQIILQITNNAEEANMKKVLAVFSITNGELHWTGTVRGENDQVVAFTEEGLDALFEVNEPSEEELEDII